MIFSDDRPRRKPEFHVFLEGEQNIDFFRPLCYLKHIILFRGATIKMFSAADSLTVPAGARRPAFFPGSSRLIHGNASLDFLRQRIIILLAVGRKKREPGDEPSRQRVRELSRDEEPDEELVRRFQDGDEAAFDRIVVRHAGRVYSLCRRFIGNDHDADDCAQEVFIKLHRTLRGFSFGSAFTTWLYRVTVNTALDMVRSSAYKKGTRERSLAGEAAGSGKERGPHGAMVQRETVAAIHEALLSLDGKERMAAILCDIEGKGYGEIAEILSMNEGTVKSTLYRARKKLRTLLRDYYDEID